MININTATLSVPKKDVAFLDAGIHENVALVGARKGTATNGNSFIELTFDKNGSKLKHTEFKPSVGSFMTEEMVNEKTTKQASRIMDILKCFYTEEQLAFDGEYDAFTTWAVALLEGADKTKLVRIKAVYGRTGYVTLPPQAGYTFIEPMTVSTNDSMIRALSMDVFTRPEKIDDKEEVTTSGAETFTSPATNGIPF